MTEEAKGKLKALSKVRVVCAKCGSLKSYRNPMAKCFECGKKFCYDHIYGCQFKTGMGINEKTRDICQECRKLGYRDL